MNKDIKHFCNMAYLTLAGYILFAMYSAVRGIMRAATSSKQLDVLLMFAAAAAIIVAITLLIRRFYHRQSFSTSLLPLLASYASWHILFVDIHQYGCFAETITLWNLPRDIASSYLLVCAIKASYIAWRIKRNRTVLSTSKLKFAVKLTVWLAFFTFISVFFRGDAYINNYYSIRGEPRPTEITSPQKVIIKALKSILFYGRTLEDHHAHEIKYKGKTNRKSGEFAAYGSWDYGNCNGGDKWMCGSYSNAKILCEKPFEACASGVAIAINTYKGDGECVIRWWKWVCK